MTAYYEYLEKRSTLQAQIEADNYRLTTGLGNYIRANLEGHIRRLKEQLEMLELGFKAGLKNLEEGGD